MIVALLFLCKYFFKNPSRDYEISFFFFIFAQMY